MAISITEKILQSNRFYSDKYLKDTIDLTKSIVIVNSKEAELYNDYIELTHPSFIIDTGDRATWRYYLHLSARYHPLDTPISIISIDNGLPIQLTREILQIHRGTHSELLKFDRYYKEVVDQYPDLELYIRSTIATTPIPDIQTIINSPDYKIIHHNTNLVETNEEDLIWCLQERIDNYKPTRLLHYYSLSDTLYMASLYHILYTYILTSILAIRLQNVKTIKAHSYHILNFLASHHKLDIYYRHLTKKQSLFLYRNLLYLDNHSGLNGTFETLIERLFTERNVSVVNYTFNQQNETTDADYMEYVFNQRLLNKANLVHSVKDFSLDEVLDKELIMAPDNTKEKKYNTPDIDFDYKNVLSSTFFSKDIEALIVDATDAVKHKLIPTLIDYWAYLLKTSRMTYIVTIINPLTNTPIRLGTSDLFKLFVILLFKIQRQEILEFPQYQIQRVYKDPLPTRQELLSKFYLPFFYHRPLIDEILFLTPKYTSIITPFQYEQYLRSVYRHNIALWLLVSNTSDVHDAGQIDNLIENMHQSAIYEFNDETVTEFLQRIGLEDISNYPHEAIETISYSILNGVFNNNLEFLNSNKYLQKALISVFRNFNSYTIQVIDDYKSSSPILAGPAEPRVNHTTQDTFYYFYDMYILSVGIEYILTKSYSVYYDETYDHTTTLTANYHLQVPYDSVTGVGSHSNIVVTLNEHIVNAVEPSEWMVNSSTEQDLQFLLTNL